MHSKMLGAQLACALNGISPADLDRRAGMAKVASANETVLGRTVAKAAYEIMTYCGRGECAPAQHLLLLSKQANWHPQFQDAVDLVIRASQATQEFQKSAVHSGDITGAIGSTLKGLGYGSLVAGTGVGSLAWLLSRHASQDDADIEAMKRQRDYYQQLTSEIEESMKRKYQYEEPEKPRYQGRR